jgi:hypothetical protein
MKKYLKVFLPVNNLDCDIFLPFALPIKLLTWFGLWIIKDSPSKYILYSLFMRAVTLLLVLLGVIYLWHLKDLLDFINIMCILPATIDLQIETVVFYFNMGNVLSLFDMIRECGRKYGIGESYRKQLLVVDKLFKFFFVGAIETIVSFSLFGIMSHEFICMIWTPFDLSVPFNFWSTLAFQIACTIPLTFWNISFIFFPVIFMTYIVGMLTELCEQLETIHYEPFFAMDGQVNKKWRNNRLELIKCIDYQLEIHEITEKFTSTFTVVFLLRGFSAIALFGTSAFAMIMISDVLILTKLLIYLALTMMSIFVPCYYGSKITDLSEKINKILFGSEWIQEDREYRRVLIIAMEYAKRPIKISTLGIFNVNLETFKAICESTYSMYCVFKNAMGK